MRCVKCGSNLTTAVCTACGFNHKERSFIVLEKLDESYCIISSIAAFEGVSETEVDLITQYENGKECFQSADYDAAIRWLWTPAKKGNANSQFLLGQIFDVSEKHSDQARAIYWYEQAAARGNAHAMNILIQHYESVKPVDATEKERFAQRIRQWREKLQTMKRNEDDRSAQHIHQRYSHADPKPSHDSSIHPNSRTAKATSGTVQSNKLPFDATEFNWWQEAATQGSVDDMRKLSQFYLTGKGVLQNSTSAQHWAQKADLIERDNALYPLGNRYYWGSEEADRKDAFSRYLKWAEQGSAYAQLWVGDCYFFGRGVNADKAEAVKWYQKSAVQGYAEAQYWLGYCYANGFGVTQSDAQTRYWLSKALQWITKAAEHGYSKEQTILGECYFWGYGVPYNRTTAVNWFRKAAEQEYADAQYWLGICYSKGGGVGKNLSEAEYWYRKAASQGHAEARVQLRKIAGAT